MPVAISLVLQIWRVVVVGDCLGLCPALRYMGLDLILSYLIRSDPRHCYCHLFA